MCQIRARLDLQARGVRGTRGDSGQSSEQAAREKWTFNPKTRRPRTCARWGLRGTAPFCDTRLLMQGGLLPCAPCCQCPGGREERALSIRPCFHRPEGRAGLFTRVTCH